MAPWLLAAGLWAGARAQQIGPVQYGDDDASNDAAFQVGGALLSLRRGALRASPRSA